jgi:hypothetical protein
MLELSRVDEKSSLRIEGGSRTSRRSTAWSSPASAYKRQNQNSSPAVPGTDHFSVCIESKTMYLQNARANNKNQDKRIAIGIKGGGDLSKLPAENLYSAIRNRLRDQTSGSRQVSPPSLRCRRGRFLSFQQQRVPNIYPPNRGNIGGTIGDSSARQPAE